MRRFLLLTAAISSFAWLAAHAQGAAQGEQFRGDHVPTGADCAASPLRLRVGADEVTLVNGKDEESFGNVAWPTSYFGPDYTGIAAVAIPDGDSGNQLFSIYFNADEKKGVTRILFEEGVERPEPQFQAYAEIFRKAKALKQRFPLGDVDLKQCGAGK
jgi:hypothetical protein